MKNLKGYQKKFLKAQAHRLKPVVFIGQKGLTATLIEAIHEALGAHELIKVKFVEFKDRQQKRSTAEAVAAEVDCQLVDMIGHTVIFYRQQTDPEKRKIQLPQR